MGWIAPVVSLATTAIGALSKSGQNTSHSLGPTPEDVAANESIANTALNQQNAFTQQVNQQTPQAVMQQQALSQMLMQQAQGGGPNPAQAALNQATGQNVSNQAALMASHRGAGANAGMIARQAAMQGGALQQQAAGQSATLQAQQQLAAQNALASLSGNQINQAGNANNTYANAALTNQGQFMHAQQAASANDAAAQQANANASGKLIGGLIGGAGSAFGSMFGGSGGGGGGGGTNGLSADTVPTSTSATAYKGGPVGYAAGGSIMQGGPRSMFSSMPMMAQGGQVDALLSPGEGYISPGNVKAVASGALPAKQAMKKVPGKPAKKGDHLSNDVVPAKLEKGGFVIPNSIMQSDSPEKKAQEFVAAYFMKRKGK